jgi:adenine deaminase
LDKQLQSLVDEIESASGKIDADMHIANLRILDVYTETVYPGAMVIKNGKIVAINPSWTVQAEQVFDGRGMFAVPGFMDAHVHIETTLLTPEALASVIVPWGTTTMFVDAMEIANVSGIKGLRALLSNTANLSFRTFMEVPSRVPTAPGWKPPAGSLALRKWTN